MTESTQGALLSLTTAFCWTLSSLAFTSASRRVGSLVVNLIRLVIAFGFMSIWGFFHRGMLWPRDATAHHWYWLTLSGVVGFFIGDMALFRAFVVVGARVSTLLMSLAPPMAAIVGFLLLEERLDFMSWIGMAVTLGGIVWVISERLKTEDQAELRALPKWGIALGIIAALGQAIGLVLTKKGTGSGPGAYDPVAATQIRCLAGIGVFAILLALLGLYPRVLDALRRTDAMGYMTLGAFTGPFVGVCLLNFAIQMIPTGVAQTITAMVPVMIIPFVVVLHRERVSWRAILGACVAVAGVAILTLS